MAVLAGLVGAYLARRLAVPLVNLTGTATRIAGGEMGLQAVVAGPSEIASLATTFNSMTQQLRSFIGGLEQRVAERTAELSKASESLAHRANQLQVSSEVSRVATTLTDPEQLISQVVELIRERFDFYYVGLFLVDADNRYAVLQQGTGEAGRVMKERGHRLEIGSQSMVSWVCANKQARIALDVGQDAVHFANPLLPDTRSEMALPLRAGERVVGALDVQSTQVAAFDQDDITALQGLADQIAIALENARLFQQTRSALNDLEAANRLLVRQSWQAYMQQPSAVRRAVFQPSSAPASEQAAEPLTVPLELRGQLVGRLTLRREDDKAWSNEEIEIIQTIVQQTMLAADNARLFEAAQRRAAREQLINEITARIRSSATMEAVLNSAAREIRRVTDARHAAIELELTQ
jgi:GAF domain-containing protein